MLEIHVAPEITVTTAAIRDTIKMAIAHEQQSGHLLRLFEQYVSKGTPAALRLPQEGAPACLVTFVIAYIQHVPELLDAIRAITKEARIEEYADVFLQLAEDFFLKPPEIVADQIGLEELMDEAYLAHRLMEEVNDRFMIQANAPLLPINMTLSNLIIHSLIGEPFANELDEAVCYTVERAMMKEHVYQSEAFKAYIARHKNNQWKSKQKHWPCLTDDLPIRLLF